MTWNPLDYCGFDFNGLKGNFGNQGITLKIAGDKEGQERILKRFLHNMTPLPTPSLPCPNYCNSGLAELHCHLPKAN